MAKKEVFGTVGIDMIAGPSEVLIIADESAEAHYIAADMLAQAEHDKLSSAILITNVGELAETVQKQLQNQLRSLPRKDIARASLDRYGAILITQTLDEAVDVANRIAGEHLELFVREPWEIFGRVKNAGAIFMGAYAPEPLGDYFAGPNHVLPTNSTARFSSPLSVDDFIKKTSIIGYSQDALKSAYRMVAVMARSEQLEAHARSVEIRFKDKK